MTVYTVVIIYDQQGSRPSEVYSASCVRVHCTGYLYCLNQELKFLYKKKQVPNERIYGARVDFASQWLCMCLRPETSINMEFSNMNEVLYDRWNKSLITYIT